MSSPMSPSSLTQRYCPPLTCLSTLLRKRTSTSCLCIFHGVMKHGINDPLHTVTSYR
jgi:hypothetical protein